MSSTRRLGVVVYGNASGYVGMTQQVISGTTRMARGFRDAVGRSSLLNNQVKALGTTFRYALAGSIIFGITGALNKLQDFETQLGTIDSLAGQLNQQGKFQGLGSQLDDIGSQAIKMSDRFGQSVTDVEAYMTRFYSTFQPYGTISRRTQEMEGFTNSILQLQTALGTEAGDPSALAAGIGGLVNTIPGGKRNIAATTRRLGNIIAYLTQVTPNITGQDIANAAGRLTSVYNVANMSPEQMFAVYGQAAKAGGSPTIITRGITQLLGASLLHPTTPNNLAAYQAAGLPTSPSALRKMGGFQVLEKLMQAAAPQGLKLSHQQLQTINSQAYSQSPEKIYTNKALQGLNLDLLYKLFGRQQSVQQFVNILSQGGVQGLKDYIRHQQDAIKADLLRQRADIALHRQGMMILRNAFSNVSLSLVRGLNEPMSVLGRTVSKVSDELAAHRTTTQVGEAVAATALATRLIGKLPYFKTLGNKWTAEAAAAADAGIPIGVGKRLFRGTVGVLSGIGKAQQAAVGAAIMTEEAGNVAAGLTPDGSRANPFWVIISPWSWQFGQGGMGQGGAGGGGNVPPIVTGVGRAATLARIATVLGVGYGSYEVGKGIFSGKQPAGVKAHQGWSLNDWKWSVTHPGAILQMGGADLRKAFGGGGDWSKAMAIKRGLEAAHVKTSQLRDLSVSGTAKADLRIHLVDKNGNEITVVEKKGVPIAVVKDVAPHSQGRPGVRSGK